MNEEIKLIITDFDGTLVDTFEANLCAYQEAFVSCGLQLHVCLLYTSPSPRDTR